MKARATNICELKKGHNGDLGAMPPVWSKGRAPGQGVRSKAKIFAFSSNFKLKYNKIQLEPMHESHFCGRAAAGGIRNLAFLGLHAACGPCVALL